MERNAIQIPLQHGDVDAPRIDLEQLADAVCDEMKGKTTRQEICQALEQILHQYQDARFWGFVPTLIRREVTEMLTGKIPSSTSTIA